MSENNKRKIWKRTRNSCNDTCTSTDNDNSKNINNNCSSRYYYYYAWFHYYVSNIIQKSVSILFDIFWMLLLKHFVFMNHLQSFRRRRIRIILLFYLLHILLSSSSVATSFLPKNKNGYRKRIRNHNNNHQQQQYQKAFIYHHSHQNQINLVKKNNILFHNCCRIYNERCYYKSQYHNDPTTGSRLCTMIMRMNVGNTIDNDNDNDSINNNNKQYLIYLIDDDESVRIAVSQFLISNNFIVQTFDNGRTALDTLYTNMKLHEHKDEHESTRTKTNINTNKAIPDLIISDIRMPGYMDGIEIVQEIRSQTQSNVNVNNNVNNIQSIPIILLTAKGLVQDRIVGYNTGADVYLTKPFDPYELLVIIQTTILHRERILRQQQQQSQESLSLSSSTTTTTSSSSPINIRDMQRDLNEIKQLLLQQLPQSTTGSTDEYTTIQSTTNNFEAVNNSNTMIQQQQQQQQQESTGQNNTNNNNTNNNNNIVISPNDRKVLELLCDGYMNKEIAVQLNVSTRRIEQILTNLYRTTHTKNRTELVRYVISNNIILL